MLDIPKRASTPRGFHEADHACNLSPREGTEETVFIKKKTENKTAHRDPTPFKESLFSLVVSADTWAGTLVKHPMLGFWRESCRDFES